MFRAVAIAACLALARAEHGFQADHHSAELAENRRFFEERALGMQKSRSLRHSKHKDGAAGHRPEAAHKEHARKPPAHSKTHDSIDKAHKTQHALHSHSKHAHDRKSKASWNRASLEASQHQRMQH